MLDHFIRLRHIHSLSTTWSPQARSMRVMITAAKTAWLTRMRMIGRVVVSAKRLPGGASEEVSNTWG
jgi:hypothetical protein